MRANIRATGIAFLALACGGGAKDATAPPAPVTPPPNTTPVVASIIVAPDAAVLLAGDSIQLTASIRDQNGQAMVGQTVAWTTSRASIATVSSTGMVRALAADTATITASVAQKTGTARVSVSAPATALRSPILGINLWYMADWARDWAFADAFKGSREWISNRTGAGWGLGGPLDLTPEGWVRSLEQGQHAVTLMLTDEGSTRHPAGQYVVLYDGDGTLEFPLNPGVTVLSQSTGRIVLNVTPNTNSVSLWVRVARTTPANPVRNIRVVMPGLEPTYASQPFNPIFLERLAPFKVIRFMNWQAANEIPPGTWASRSRPEIANYTGRSGVPVEVMVQLANRLRADPWFCMPHLADDGYIRSFAQMVRDRLGQSQKVYVEYTNETWNSIFPQFAYVNAQGLALGLSNNQYEAGLFYYSRRSVQIFKIWREVFGADSGRVVRVLASQAASSGKSKQIIDFEDAFRHADVLAIAPYFDGGLGSPTATSLPGSTAEVLAALRTDIQTTVRGRIRANKVIATARGLQLVAYEAGQHLVSGGMMPGIRASATTLFANANRDPGMADVYREFFDVWKAEGGGLVAAFALTSPFGQSGHWGALEYINQDISTAPKYRALLDFIVANPVR